ncbi:MAG: cysteine rich repeat-containing protein [Zoogloea sp.]|uniref:cysteine rich repeat-containing protein n=1 Tax=Zoogloea sp. TaxID=49181 RepID=UPI003F33CD31
MKRWLLLSLLGLLSFSTLAQEPQAQACRSDAQQFCAQSSNPKDIKDCLLDHQQDISDGCYDALKQKMGEQQGVKACMEDAKQLCQGVEPGGGRMMACLKEHRQALSDACYDFLSSRMKSRR